jgi:hypothetical protein
MSSAEYDWERFAATWRNSRCVRSGEVGPLLAPSQERRFLIRRKAVLRQLAESRDWSRYVQPA